MYREEGYTVAVETDSPTPVQQMAAVGVSGAGRNDGKILRLLSAFLS